MKPILIAEACQNHNGKREILKRMIHAAAENGADFVKIQSIRSRDVTFRDRFEEGIVGKDGVRRAIKRPYAEEMKRMKQLELSVDDEAWFVEECLRAGVGSMATVFTRSSARQIKDLGYDAVKIASYDCGSFPLLRDVRQWWAKIFVSTGASYDSEIEKAAEILEGRLFTFLHCVTIYPTPLEECHFRRTQYLRRFTPYVGWSDHTLVERDGVWASKIALALGADCVERHFTVLDFDKTKDGPISIRSEQLKELREFSDRARDERMAIIRSEYPSWETTLGRIQRPLSLVEHLNRDYYRGRFAAPDGKGGWIYNWEDILI